MKLHNFLRYLALASQFIVNANVMVTGNQTVSSEKIKIIVDCVFDLNEMKKALYESDLFDEVDVEKLDDDIHILVKEKKTISKIYYFIDGKKKQKEDIGSTYDNLEQITNFKLGQMIDEQKIALACAKIEQYYLQQGYSYAAIKHSIISDDHNHQLHVDIKLGPKFKIKDVKILGLKNLNYHSIRKILTPRIKNYVFFYVTSHEPYMLQQDLPTILQFAADEGFLETKIKHTYIENHKNDQTIVIVVDEGKRFHFRDIKLELDHEIVPQTCKCNLSGVANKYKILELKEKLIKAYSKSGQLVDVEYQEHFDDNKVDIIFKLKLHSKKSVASSVVIKGNTRTRNDVIFQIMKFAAGDYFDKNTLRKIETRLTESGLFKNVHTTAYADPNDKELRQIIVISLEEAAIGEIGLMGNAMYAKSWEFSLNLFYGYPNMFGKNHHGMLNVILGTAEKSFLLGYRIPSIFNKDISLATNFWVGTNSSGATSNSERNLNMHPDEQFTLEDAKSSFGYKVFSTSLNSALGFDLFDFGFLKTNTGIEFHEITPSDTAITQWSKAANAALLFNRTILPQIRGVEGCAYDEYAQELKYDTKIRFFDSKMLPINRFIFSTGFSHKIGKTFSRTQNFVLSNTVNFCFDSNVAYMKYTPHVTHTYPLTRSHEVYVKSSVGYGFIASFRDKHYWIDNFSSGEVYIKGFKGVGPLETMRYTELGGTHKFNAYTELITPFILPPEWKMTTFFGFYCGSLWGTKYNPQSMLPQYAHYRMLPYNTQDMTSTEFDLRASASTGIRWNIGPFKLEFAFNTILKQSQTDLVKTLSFQIKM